MSSLRLWVSYQRYACLLLGLPACLTALAALYAPLWATVLVVLAGIAPARFGVEVLARWPRKLRATRAGLAKIAAGTFTPAFVRSYCGDPCFRVVASELLARAGMPRAARRALVRQFADEVRRERDIVVFVDHVRGTVITLGGDAGERT